jgi:hypothetical protein
MSSPILLPGSPGFDEPSLSTCFACAALPSVCVQTPLLTGPTLSSRLTAVPTPTCTRPVNMPPRLALSFSHCHSSAGSLHVQTSNSVTNRCVALNRGASQDGSLSHNLGPEAAPHVTALGGPSSAPPGWPVAARPCPRPPRAPHPGLACHPATRCAAPPCLRRRPHHTLLLLRLLLPWRLLLCQCCRCGRRRCRHRGGRARHLSAQPPAAAWLPRLHPRSPSPCCAPPTGAHAQNRRGRRPPPPAQRGRRAAACPGSARPRALCDAGTPTGLAARIPGGEGRRGGGGDRPGGAGGAGWVGGLLCAGVTAREGKTPARHPGAPRSTLPPLKQQPFPLRLPPPPAPMRLV